MMISYRKCPSVVKFFSVSSDLPQKSSRRRTIIGNNDRRTIYAMSDSRPDVKTGLCDYAYIARYICQPELHLFAIRDSGRVKHQLRIAVGIFREPKQVVIVVVDTDAAVDLGGVTGAYHKMIRIKAGIEQPPGTAVSRMWVFCVTAGQLEFNKTHKIASFRYALPPCNLGMPESCKPIRRTSDGICRAI